MRLLACFGLALVVLSSGKPVKEDLDSGFTSMIVELEAALDERKMKCVDPPPVSNNGGTVSAKTWRGVGGKDQSFSWPELEIDEVKEKCNSALVFSGGGARSYLLTLGYLRGLLDLGLLDKTRYISGVSGGSWATAAFSFYAQGEAGAATNDEEFLGPIFRPEELTTARLKEMNDTCGRTFAQQHVIAEMVKQVVNCSVPLTQAWPRAVSRTLLEPYGVAFDSMMSLNAATVADVIRRNPSLQKRRFATQRHSRPLIVLATALVAPSDQTPLVASKRTYTVLESTPLYVGEIQDQEVVYTPSPLCLSCGANHTAMVGGFVEPIGMGGVAPTSGLAPSVPFATLSLPQPDIDFNVAWAAGSSGWAPGGALSLLPVVDELRTSLQYWSPSSSAPTSREFNLGDGGVVENIDITGMLRRSVDSLVVFCNFQVPIAPAEVWNPYDRDPTSDDIDDDVPAFFGIDVDTSMGWDLRRNQVFNQSDFPRVASALQSAASKGNGAVATTSLTTVPNDWYSVAGGRVVNVTWVYLSRAPAWETRLPEETSRYAVPKDNPTDLRSTPSSGPYKNFPHYSTFTQLHRDAAQSNLLSNLAGWVIQENQDVFRQALAGAACQDV